MQLTRTISAAVLSAGVLIAGVAEAALIATNGGLTVTDTTTGVTWLANANYAATLRPPTPGNPVSNWVPGIELDGSMTLGTAEALIKQMNSNHYLGHTNWSLPTSWGPDPGCSLASPSPPNRFGYNCAIAANPPTVPVGNQMGGLFYNALGGQALNSILQTHNSGLSLFSNFQPYYYWSGSPTPTPPTNFGYNFSFGNGFQGTNLTQRSSFVIPQYSGTPTAPAPAKVDLGAPQQNVATPSLVPNRNGQLVYDPILNVNWLANGNLAGTLPSDSPYLVPGISADGSMDFITATNWIAQLNARHYLGFSAWALPSTVSLAAGRNTNCSIQPAQQDSPAIGYDCYYDNQLTEQDQLAELFYNQLGGVAGGNILFTHNDELNLFNNLRPGDYWSTGPSDPNLPNGAPSFSMEDGFLGSNFGGTQTNPLGGNTLFVIPVLPVRAIFAGTPGYSNCRGQSEAALASEFGGIDASAAALAYPSVKALQTAIGNFCRK
jgi:hypothetical protein